MKRKWLVLLAIVSVLIFVVAGCAPAAPPVEKPPVEKVVWKFAAHSPPTSVSSIAAKWFFDEVGKRSEGRFEIQYFWSQSLCPAKEQLISINSGLCHVAGIYPGYFLAQLPLFNISSLPCLFPTEDSRESYLAFVGTMNEWLQTPLLKEELAKWDTLMLSECWVPFYTLMGKVRVTNLEELKGKRIKAAGGIVHLFKKAGAVPVSIIVPETYDALAKGTIDLASLAWGQFLSYRLYEPSKFWITGVNLMQSPYPTGIKLTAYEALPGDIKQIFQELSEEFPEVLADLFVEKHREAIETFNKAGIVVVEFSAEDNEKLREMAREVWKEKVDKLEKQGLPGRECFNSLQDIMKKHFSGYEPHYL